MNENGERKELGETVKEARALFHEIAGRYREICEPWRGLSRPGGVETKPSSASEGDTLSADERGLPGVPALGDSLVQVLKDYADMWEALVESRSLVEGMVEERSSLQAEAARFSEQIMLLGRARAEASEESERLKRDLEESSRSGEKLQGTVRDLENEVSDLKARLQTLSEETAAHQVRKKTESESVEMLRQESEGLRKEKGQIETKLAESQQLLEGLRSEVESLRQERDAAHGRVSEVEGEIAEIKESTIALDDFRTVEESLKQAQKSLSERIETSVPAQDYERLKQDLEGLRAEREALEDQGKSQIEKILRLEDETNLLRSKSRQSEIEKLNAEKNREESEIRNRKSDREIRDLRDLLEKATREMDVLKRAREESTPAPSLPQDFEEPVLPEISELGLLGDGEVSTSETVLESETDQSGAPSTLESETAVFAGEAVEMTEEEEKAEKYPGGFRKESSYVFPYPEITGKGMESFHGRKVLLIGGDERFRPDYEHLFEKVGAGLVYFPGTAQLERNGTKRHVRDCDVIVVFGGAVEEPGVLRLKDVASDYGRPLVEHRSSGLVSLYHELQKANREL